MNEKRAKDNLKLSMKIQRKRKDIALKKRRQLCLMVKNLELKELTNEIR